MKKGGLFYIFILLLVLIISGCVARTYPLTRDRVDQDLSSTAGNRGYIQGQPPYTEPKDRKLQRTVQVVEIELGVPAKLEKKADADAGKAMDVEYEAVTMVESASMGDSGAGASMENLEKYTVQKGDTLQKISQKLYGTTKKWTKIYDANRDVLRAPDKIYPGQVINVPAREAMKEPKENLK